MGQKEGDKEKYQQGRWVGCDQEQRYFGDERKVSKEERKKRQAQDRSKYKKTDQQKLAKEEARTVRSQAEGLLRGRVLSIQSRGIIVEHEAKNYLCTLRGALKKEKSSYKNLITVGDFVQFELLDDREGVIAAVEPRRSILSRADNLSRRKQQLIAANIDQVLITVSVVAPPLKPALVDRYIIAAIKGNMEPVVLVNKVDLLEEGGSDSRYLEQCELYKAFMEGYSNSSVPVIPISVVTGEGFEELRAVMKDKASVFSGQSGVGKSSLINKITNLNLAVGETVAQTRKGAHTTTTAQLIPLEFGGWCIDTPGIKSFGVWNLEADEIEGYYGEIHETGLHCKFPNCSHTHENECAVKAAVENGEISFLRYSSYLSLLETVDDAHKRR